MGGDNTDYKIKALSQYGNQARQYLATPSTLNRWPCVINTLADLKQILKQSFSGIGIKFLEQKMFGILASSKQLNMI